MYQIKLNIKVDRSVNSKVYVDMSTRLSCSASSCGSANKTASVRSAAGSWRSARPTSAATPSACSCCARRRSSRSACASRTTSCAAANRRTHFSCRCLPHYYQNISLVKWQQIVYFIISSILFYMLIDNFLLHELFHFLLFI